MPHIYAFPLDYITVILQVFHLSSSSVIIESHETSVNFLNCYFIFQRSWLSCKWLYYFGFLFFKLFLKNSVANLNISQGNAANFPSSSSTFGFWYCFLFDILTALNIFSWYFIYYIHWPVDLSLPIVLFIWCCILFYFCFQILSDFVIHSVIRFYSQQFCFWENISSLYVLQVFLVILLAAYFIPCCRLVPLSRGILCVILIFFYRFYHCIYSDFNFRL